MRIYLVKKEMEDLEGNMMACYFDFGERQWKGLVMHRGEQLTFDKDEAAEVAQQSGGELCEYELVRVT